MEGESIAPGNRDKTGGDRPVRVPSRDELESHTVGAINKDRPYNADLVIVDMGEGPIVVKDFAPKPWWVRLYGWILISHECGAYRRLGEMRGVPALVGRIDRHALALETVDGFPLMTSPDRREKGEHYLTELEEILNRFEDRGFLHLDLRGRQNILLRADGQLVVLDLAGALWFRPGSLTHKFFSPLIAWNHRNTLAKWRVLLAPDTLTDEDRASLRRFRNLQNLWLFNRKGSKFQEYPHTPEDTQRVDRRNGDRR